MFFNNFPQPFETVEADVTPTRVFIGGLGIALKNAIPSKQYIILNHLANYIGCDPQALHFLITPSNLDEDISVPNFKAHVMD